MWAFEQQPIKALRLENDDLKRQADQVAPLQDELQRARQATAAGNAAIQQEQTRELARLRNEVAQLRGKTNDLAKAQQQIQSLNQRVASEAEARRGAVAEAQAAASRRNAASACINNLRLIDSAKQQWALEQRKQATDTPTMDDLRPYLGRGPNGEMPVCPDNGVYVIGAVKEKPTCSVPGHVLP